MRVYILTPDDKNYPVLIPLLDDSYDLFEKFDGKTAFKDEWKPPVMEVFVEKDENISNKDVGDFPGFLNHVPIFSEYAKDSIGKELERYGEFLALDCKQGRFYFFNVLNTPNVLDYEKSKLEHYKDGDIKNITSYVFKQPVASELIFKIPELPFMNVFVTGRFKDLVEKYSLKGILYNRIW